ncbi:MAG: hypothetical protein ACNA7J_02185 [Wenzhouxiangella sp.]
MRSAKLSIGPLLRTVAGLVVWASAFVFLYAGYSLGCQHIEISDQAGLLNPVTVMLITFSLAHLGALLVLLVLWRKRPPRPAADEPPATYRFRYWLEGAILLFSLLGVVMIAFPILMVTPCVG